jgi:DtxR family Mn-dependent transcriptional regulator
MPSSTVENYVKQIFVEQQRRAGNLVPMGRIADIMEVVPGTATSMVKALAESGLVTYEPREGTRLTEGGKKLALHVLRRHRLVEQFLVESLGLDWSEVHEEAESLEHTISEKVLARMDEILGHPRFDPHGDPIPSSTGAMESSTFDPLDSCTEGSQARVTRILDQDPAFLQFIDRSGLTPGVFIEVVSKNSAADALTIQIKGGQSMTLGLTAAMKILVHAQDPAA